MRTDPRRVRVLLAWGLVLVVCGGLIASRLQFSYDLGLFLPEPRGLAQEVLVQRVGDAPGSRYLIVVLPEGVKAEAGLADRLASDPSIERVLGAGGAPGPDALPEPAWRYRYLLTDVDWSAEGLQTALEARLAELGIAPDPGYETLLRRDPTLQSITWLETLDEGRGERWRTRDGRRILVAETTATAFDLDGQQAAIGHVRAVLAGSGVDIDRVELSGAGVFGTELRETIHAEAAWRTALASLALAVVLLLAYRRPAVLWLGGIPLLTGLVAGLAGVTLAFGEIHGITLAFGFTLLGVAIDYPLHYLSHIRPGSPRGGPGRIWPTLRLGAASTALAYGALAFGGARGIAQLGLFSAIGVVAAALATRWVLPALAGDRAGETAPEPPAAEGRPAARLRFGPLITALLIGAGLLLMAGDGRFWSRDLSALSPVPAEHLARDADLRAALGAPSMRYQLALRVPDPDMLLERSAGLHGPLRAAVDRGWLDGFRDLESVLPLRSVQLARRAGIPEPGELRDRLEAAVAGLPFSAAAFEGFLEDAAASRSLAPLAPGDFADSELETLLDRFRVRLPQRDGPDAWAGLVELSGSPDVEALRSWLAARAPDVELVDFRQASEALVGDYQRRTWRVLAGAMLVIAALLLWRVRLRRALWSVLTVAAGLVLTAALLRWWFGSLNLYHMMGLVLVAGLGLDYSLFLGRPEDEARDTRHAVATCVASTVMAFGILAASMIPALRSLGACVALGAGCCFVLARTGAAVSGGRGPRRQA